MATLQTDGDKYLAQQDKDAVLDYSLDWADWLSAGDTIDTSVWAADAGVILTNQSTSGAITSVWVSGGTPGSWYSLTNSVVSANGKRDQRTIQLLITDQAQAGSALFSNRSMAIGNLRNAIKRTVLSVIGGIDYDDDDDEIWSLLMAAEKDASRQLRVFFTPTEVFPPNPSQADIDALAGKPWVEDAAYDYDPEFFQGESWGFISTRHKPVSAVSSISFRYPSPTAQVFSIPSEWIRVDKKYGHIRLVPAASAFAAPLSAFVMQALGGGRTIPSMLHVRYTAGLTNAADEYPDLVDLVKKMAVLRVLQGAFPAQSGSISGDGLSQSLSVDMDKWQSIVDHGLAEMRDALHGVRMGFL